MMERFPEVIVRPATREDAEFLIRGNAQPALETEDLQLDTDRLRSGVHGIFDDRRADLTLLQKSKGHLLAR
jgi:hypothetical protein